MLIDEIIGPTGELGHLTAIYINMSRNAPLDIYSFYTIEVLKILGTDTARYHTRLYIPYSLVSYYRYIRKCTPTFGGGVINWFSEI